MFFGQMRLLIIIVLIFLTADILACSCGRVGILKAQKGSDLVFVGRVVKVNEVTTKEKITGTETEIEYRRYEFTFKVTSVYKGRKSSFMKDTITIVTTGGGSDCGNWFRESEKYLIYSYKSDKKLGMRIEDQTTDLFITTNVCTRTKMTGLLTFWERLILRLS